MDEEEMDTMKLYTSERMDPFKEVFEADVLLFPDVEPRKMMGCPCYMARGKMFATLMDDAVVLTKLGEGDRARLEEEMGAGPFTHGQKVMAKWVRVPVKEVGDLAAILPFVRRSYEAALDQTEVR